MTRAVLLELLRPRSGFLFLSIVLFDIYFASQVTPGTGQNAWNVVYPAVTGDKFAVVLGLMWWVFVLIENAQRLSSPDVLLRFGSRFRAVRMTIARNLGEFLVGVVIVGITSIAVSAPAGLSAFWSDATITAADATATPPAFTTLHGAQTFSSPLLAIGAFGMFSAIALIGLSTVHATLCVTGKSRLASGGAMVLYLWSASCTFGVAAAVPAINTSTLFDLEWATEQHAVPFVVFVWSATAAVSFTALWFMSTSGAFSELFARWWSVLIVPCGAFVFALGSQGTTPQQRWDFFFAGQNDSLTGYVRAASLIYAGGTIAVMQFFDASDEQLVYRQIRYGTRWHALRPHLTRAALVTTISSITLTGAAALAVSVSATRPGPLDVRVTALAGAGALLSTWVITAMGLFVATATRAPQSWVWVMACGLVGGYSGFIPLGPLNVFALYSSASFAERAMPWEGFNVALGLVTIATLAIVTKTVWLPRRNRILTLQRIGTQWISSP